MIIRKNGYVLDVDVEGTLKYSQEHKLCDCDEDRNLYAQIAEKFPELKEFLAELGLLIERPDEIGSCVTGKILEFDNYEIDMFDGGLFLNNIIDNCYVPNEQRTDKYFTVTIYGIDLPWVLDEPFPECCVSRNRMSLLARIKSLFHRN